jgi:hypothetical protein
MAKTDTLKRLSTEIIKNYLIFDPTSNSTKPPHIANGLFRLCTGETCDTKDVHEWIVSERRSNSQNADKILSSADIVEKYQEVLQEGNLENPENIKKFRFLLEEVFNQDNTVYPEYAFSTMTISSHWLVKGRISSEAHIGDFLYGILCKEVNGKRSPAIDLIRKALKNDSDDLTKLINPIIAFPSQEAKRHLDEVEYLSEEEIKWDACKAKLREGFDRLALNIQHIGEERNTLLVLRRMICFAGFATFAYLTHANHAIYSGVNPPIVVDSGGDFDSIKKASEQSYTFAKKAVEDYFVNTIYGIIKSEIASSGDDRACKKWIDEMTVGRAAQEDEIKGAIKSYYNSFCEEGEKPILALSRALQIALYTFEYRNNSPSDYCRVLGTRCGLIGPKGNRAKVKRYLTNSFTLETITLSILSTNDLENGIELKELSEKAISAYNLLLGANADEEYNILEGCNIAQATPGDLRGDLSLNAQRLADTYISLGLAKRYADGVTLIGWRL